MPDWCTHASSVVFPRMYSDTCHRQHKRLLVKNLPDPSAPLSVPESSTPRRKYSHHIRCKPSLVQSVLEKERRGLGPTSSFSSMASRTAFGSFATALLEECPLAGTERKWNQTYILPREVRGARKPYLVCLAPAVCVRNRCADRQYLFRGLLCRAECATRSGRWVGGWEGKQGSGRLQICKLRVT